MKNVKVLDVNPNYEDWFKDVIRAFNSNLVTYDEMCELTMNGIDKRFISKLKNQIQTE
jgi:hypothetical protein